jgi:hypothetical protein
MVSYGKRLGASAGTASVLCGVLLFTPFITTVAFPADPNTAADSVLGDAISQTRSLMQSMSQGCSGGASGVPPVNWGALQPQGNAALNAFQNARVALARGDMATVVQQINAGEAGLDNLVNGAHDNCSGGAHGVDPIGYAGYLAIRAAVKGQLEVVKRFLS